MRFLLHALCFVYESRLTPILNDVARHPVTGPIAKEVFATSYSLRNVLSPRLGDFFCLDEGLLSKFLCPSPTGGRGAPTFVFAVSLEVVLPMNRVKKYCAGLHLHRLKVTVPEASCRAEVMTGEDFAVLYCFPYLRELTICLLPAENSFRYFGEVWGKQHADALRFLTSLSILELHGVEFADDVDWAALWASMKLLTTLSLDRFQLPASRSAPTGWTAAENYHQKQTHKLVITDHGHKFCLPSVTSLTLTGEHAARLAHVVDVDHFPCLRHLTVSLLYLEWWETDEVPFFFTSADETSASGTFGNGSSEESPQCFVRTHIYDFLIPSFGDRLSSLELSDDCFMAVSDLGECLKHMVVLKELSLNFVSIGSMDCASIKSVAASIQPSVRKLALFGTGVVSIMALPSAKSAADALGALSQLEELRVKSRRDMLKLTDFVRSEKGMLVNFSERLPNLTHLEMIPTLQFVPPAVLQLPNLARRQIEDLFVTHPSLRAFSLNYRKTPMSTDKTMCRHWFNLNPGNLSLQQRQEGSVETLFLRSSSAVVSS